MQSYSRKYIKYSNEFIMVGQTHHAKCVGREKDDAKIIFQIKFKRKF